MGVVRGCLNIGCAGVITVVGLGALILWFGDPQKRSAGDQHQEAQPPASQEPAAQAQQNAPALPEQPPQQQAPGRVRICVANEMVKFDTYKDLLIPAGAVFRDSGDHAKTKFDPTVSLKGQVAQGAKRPSFITQDSVSLSKPQPCGETNVKMFVGPTSDQKFGHADDNAVYGLADVVDYPVPAKKPPIEIGALIDNVSIKAVLLSDIGANVAGDPLLDDATKAKKCLDGACKFADYMHATLGRQTSSKIEIQSPIARDIAYGCAVVDRNTPSFELAWSGRPYPAPRELEFIARAGNYLFGATVDEMREETTSCVREAVTPDAKDAAARDFRGAKIECQAFTRDGGGGSAIVYRLLGRNPEH